MEVTNILESDIQLSKFFKALSHPVRISILRNLIDKSRCPCGCNPCKCGESCEGKNCQCGCRCGELVDLFPMSQSTVSQHIKELKNAGLIDISGRKGDYILDYTKINEGVELFLSLLEHQNSIPMMNQECCSCHSL